MAAFAGLGPIDQFDENVLEIIGENLARTFVVTKIEDFVTVPIGGNTGVGLASALRSFISGVFRGLTDSDHNHRFRGFTICELEAEKFKIIKRELMRLSSTSLFDDFEVTFDEIPVPPPSEVPKPARFVQTRVDPTYLMVRRARPADRPEMLSYEMSVLTPGSEAVIYKNQQEVLEADLEQHLARIQNETFGRSELEAFGHELVDMIIPSDIQHMMKRDKKQPLVIVHDIESSKIPWETMYIDGAAPALLGGMSRRPVAQNLSVTKWSGGRQQQPILHMLLVVDPTEDLPGAREEGDRIRDLFETNSSVRVYELRGVKAQKSVLKQEFESGKYDVIHYAGHAFFDPDRRDRSGIVCANHQVLSGRELAGIGNLPSLMFFNACEAGRLRRSAIRGYRKKQLEMQSRIERSAGLAEAIIRGGVANYIGTYWPVSDRPAKIFATAFYSKLMQGGTIGDALNIGRKKVFSDTNSIDWSDYIHYGSPEFLIKIRE